MTRSLKIGILVGSLAFSLSAFALAEDGKASSDAQAKSTELSAAAKEVFRAHCSECHQGDNAMGDVRILDYQELIENEHLVP